MAKRCGRTVHRIGPPRCLDHVIIFTAVGLQRLLTRYVDYYERSPLMAAIQTAPDGDLKKGPERVVAAWNIQFRSLNFRQRVCRRAAASDLDRPQTGGDQSKHTTGIRNPYLSAMSSRQEEGIGELPVSRRAPPLDDRPVADDGTIRRFIEYSASDYSSILEGQMDQFTIAHRQLAAEPYDGRLRVGRIRVPIVAPLERLLQTGRLSPLWVSKGGAVKARSVQRSGSMARTLSEISGGRASISLAQV